MPRPMIPMPTRDEFAAAWADASLTNTAIAKRWDVSEATIYAWGKRFGLARRPNATGKRKGHAEPVRIARSDNHCRPVGDGPGKGDPTPDEIAERAAAIKAAHIEYKRSLPA